MEQGADQGVGARIKRLREEREWSMAKLAVEADMSVSGVSMIENGKRNLTTTTLAKLARAFEVEVADLFPKAESRSSLEPSLFSGIEDERRSSRFAEAIFATADKCVGAMTTPDTDPRTAAGIVDALLTLHESVLAPLNHDAVRQSLTDEEGDEILAVAGRLIEAATTGIHRLEEAAEDEGREEDAKRMREQIREMTRRISA